MIDVTQPAVSRAEKKQTARISRGARRRARARLGFSVATAVLLVALAIGVAVSARDIATLESRLAATIARLVFASQSSTLDTPTGPAFIFDVDHHWYGIRVTVECSVALFIAVILVAGGAIVLTRRVSIIRVGVALAIGGATLVVLNQVRLLMLSYSLAELGRNAFDVSHQILGSILMLLGTGAVLLSLVLVAARSRRARGDVRGNVRRPPLSEE